MACAIQTCHKVDLELKHDSVLSPFEEVEEGEKDLHGLFYLRPFKRLDDSPNQGGTMAFVGVIQWEGIIFSMCFHCQTPVDIVWFKARQLSCGELLVSSVGPSAK
eukprot:5655940-Ditylum_brightwellii.AAC.1